MTDTNEGGAAPSQRDIILQRIRDAFSFLHAKPVLGGKCRGDDSAMSTVAYLVPPSFVEIEVDWREQDVFVLLGRLASNELPDGYYVDSHGHRCRWHLTEVLEKAGRIEASDRLKRLSANPDTPSMEGTIDAYASELRKIVEMLPAMLARMA